MIEIRNVSKAYRIFRKSRWRILDVLGLPVPRTAYDELWVLRNFNLFVPAGQRLGIIGRNGAGKSTLLRIVARLLSPTEGKVTVRGQVQALMDLGTSFHPDFTGRQNVMAALSYNGVTGKQAIRRFDEVLEFSELEDCIDNSLKTYSAGMQARLAFSVATAIQPEILIIDEVLSAGDAYFVGKCLERMKQLTVDCGATVLFVSHDLNAVQTMCDRVIWLNSGRVVLDGEPLSVSRAYYREVQEEENLRVKARSQGLSKRLAAGLQHAGSLRGPLLFHLVTVGAPHPVGSHKIRQLRLKRGEKLLAIIPVGEESDADPHKAARLLCASGDADWSPPQRDASGHFRFYKDCEGHYGHVPFQFSLPEEKEHNGGPVLHLEVRADVELGDEIAVEIFEHETYRRLGALTPGQEWHRFEFSLTGEAPDENSGNSDGDYGETSACRFYLQTDNTDYASPPRIAFVRL
ncbi:MAG: ABC transporter ATP-binding protein, partial [Nitrospiraceae bacterium]